jgi:uncharacterized protein YndB with AHSA1/START domain
MSEPTTLERTQGRTIEREVVIRAAPDRVFQALTDPAELTRWFMNVAEVDLRRGGRLRHSWDGYGTTEGRVLEADPPHRFVFTWDEGPELGETTIAIDLTPEGDGTRLRLVESGFQAGDDWDRLYADHADGWTQELENLRAWIEDGRTRR